MGEVFYCGPAPGSAVASGSESGPHPTAREGPVTRTATRTALSRSPSEPGGGPRLRAMQQAASCPWEPLSVESRFLCVDTLPAHSALSHGDSFGEEKRCPVRLGSGVQTWPGTPRASVGLDTTGMPRATAALSCRVLLLRDQPLV